MNLRKRLRGGRGDAGISLPELMVTIMIFGIVLAVVTGTFVSLTRATTQANTTDSNVRAASNGMNELTREIRGADTNPVYNAASDSPAFSEATTESLTVSTAVNQSSSAAQPQLVRFFLGADRSLTETKTAAVAYQTTYWQFTGAVSTRILTGPISVSSASVPTLFQYFDASGNALTPAANGALSSTQMTLIASITITVTVKSKRALDTGVTLTNTVGLPNLGQTGTVS